MGTVSVCASFVVVFLIFIFELIVILTSATLSPTKWCLYTTNQSRICHPLKAIPAFVTFIKRGWSSLDQQISVYSLSCLPASLTDFSAFPCSFLVTTLSHSLTQSLTSKDNSHTYAYIHAYLSSYCVKFLFCPLFRHKSIIPTPSNWPKLRLNPLDTQHRKAAPMPPHTRQKEKKMLEP